MATHAEGTTSVWLGMVRSRREEVILRMHPKTVRLYQRQLSVHLSTLSGAGVWFHRDTGGQASPFQWSRPALPVLLASLMCKLETVEGSDQTLTLGLNSIPALTSCISSDHRPSWDPGFLTCCILLRTVFVKGLA